MPQTFDAERFDAFVRLMGRPNPRDLPRCAHVCRYEGDPDRRETRLPGILMAWLQRRHLGVDVEGPLASAKRTSKRHTRSAHSGLRVLRPTGTG
jgi:hypothetical protein